MNCLLWAALIFAILTVLFNLRRMRRERNVLLQEKEVIFNFVHDVSGAFAEPAKGIPQTDFLIKSVLFYAQQTAKARAAAIYFWEPSGETLRARAVSGLFPPIAGAGDSEPDPGDDFFRRVEMAVLAHPVKAGEGLVGAVAREGVPILIEDAERDRRVPRFKSEFLRIESILLLPMRFQETVLGVLAVVNRIDDTPFIETDLNLLQALADQASISIFYAKFNEELEKKRILDDDLRLARRIQNRLLPAVIPQAPGLEIAAFSMPAREIGGDFYDFIEIDGDYLGMTIADVSGKGVAGAILMSVCRSVFRAYAPGCLSPGTVLKAVNHVIIGDIHEDMFISMLYCIFNTRTSEVTLACAGHPRPLLFSAGREIVPVEAQGVAIGLVDADAFDRSLKEVKVALRPDDFWVLFTDGVTEAMNSDGREWGTDGLRRAVLAGSAGGAAAIVGGVRRELMEFAGNTSQYDDMTLVVAHRTRG